MVTIKDISKKCGYSITTVSKALNDYSDISYATKHKILDLANEMGYIPNLSARSLVTQKSYTIGVIFEEITGVGLQHPLFSKILESFKNVCEQDGYDIMFLSKHTGGQNGSYLQHSVRKQVEGILVLCADFNSPEMIELYDSNLPMLTIDYGQPKLLNITSNNEEGIKQAVRYLRDLGHTKIANIYGGEVTYIGAQRKEFFEQSMAKMNLEIPLGYQVEGEFFSKEDGYKAMRKLLKLADPPTAIFCASDMLAIGAMQAIQQVGKHVPDDFSIIGFDGIDIGQIIHPRLTTIKQDTRKIGVLAASQILQMIDEKKRKLKGETITVDTYLVTGETTKVMR
jgi:LacI family transcriptional regulator